MSEQPKHILMTLAGTLSILFAFAGSASANTLQVGPGKTYANPSDAAAAAHDGDTIEIDAGDYHGDVAHWTANNLTIRGVGGMAHLIAEGNAYGGKAIWVISGNNTTVEYIEFSGATVPDKNGAGIRQEGAGLTVRHCYFHDNEDGILTTDNATSDILIERSQFEHNGYGDGRSHNLYINHVRSFTFQYNYSHRAHVGHELKSRAYKNYILYNRITNEDGDASYLIDLPNGGESYVIGNLLEQGPNNQNRTLVCFACEGASNPNSQVYFVNNTFVNDASAGTFIHNNASTDAVVVNNLFVGPGALVNGPAMQTTNLMTDSPAFVDQTNYDYHLTSSSPAIDQGSDPGMANGMSLVPTFQYVHPTDSQARPSDGMIDVGAYEYGTVPPPSDGGVTDGGAGSPDAGVMTDAGMMGGADGGGGGTDGGSDGGMASSASAGGCGCRVASEGHEGTGWVFALVGVVALVVTRRRWKRRPPRTSP